MRTYTLHTIHLYIRSCLYVYLLFQFPHFHTQTTSPNLLNLHLLQACKCLPLNFVIVSVSWLAVKVHDIRVSFVLLLLVFVLFCIPILRGFSVLSRLEE